MNLFKQRGARDKVAVGIRAPYLRVVGIQCDQEGRGYTSGISISASEEEEFRRLAQSNNVYERIARSVAPSIYGSEDIKKSVATLLFGGSRKRLPDGLTRRGDINVLLLGDPGTAKSQLLKFVERVAPIAVYTSGKGSSAAGLTASVTRDPVTVSNRLYVYFNITRSMATSILIFGSWTLKTESFTSLIIMKYIRDFQ